MSSSAFISSKLLWKSMSLTFILHVLFSFYSCTFGLYLHKIRPHSQFNLNFVSLYSKGSHCYHETCPLKISTFVHHQPKFILKMSTAVDDNSQNGGNSVNNNIKTSQFQIKSELSNFGTKFGSLLSALRSKFKSNNLNKENIAKLGMYVLLSYGFVSNVSYITLLIISWVIFGKANGLSPLAAGQWKGFLAVYAGLWAANNFLRPLRISLALFMSPYFENLINIVEKKTGWKRTIATGTVIFIVNIFLTVSYLFTGLILATTLARVPLLP